MAQAEAFSPYQKMALAIVAIATSPAWTAVLSRPFGLHHTLPAICAVLIPIAIPTAVIYFRNQAKRLAQLTPPPMVAPAPPMYAPQAQVQPQAPSQAPSQAWLQAPVMPVSAVPSADVLRTTPNTNPLAHQPASITEDETKRLPN
jgi:hypothetical protein